MHINAPEYISSNNKEGIKVTANIYNALPTAKVRIKIGNEGEWINMDRSPQNDPVRMAVMNREKQLGMVPWRNLGSAIISEHIWTAELKVKLDPGVYLINVESVDKWWKYEGYRLLHVK